MLIVPVLKPTTGVELVIQKTAEATGGFIGKKIADKITKISKQHSHIIKTKLKMKEKYQRKIYFPRKKKQIINALRLV